MESYDRGTNRTNVPDSLLPVQAMVNHRHCLWLRPTVPRQLLHQQSQRPIVLPLPQQLRQVTQLAHLPLPVIRQRLHLLLLLQLATLHHHLMSTTEPSTKFSRHLWFLLLHLWKSILTQQLNTLLLLRQL